jgi:lactate dehydrogenase-like 2-hydroxyacid dehydrogenase
MGEIGTELARRLRGMNCTVLYNKRNPLPPDTEAELGVRYGTVADLQSQSDFLCVLVPHSPETAEMINAAFLANVKPGALLISTGTSTALNEADVADAVRSGQLGGMATDGYLWEPIRPDNPLLSVARDPRYNVILTPHVAGGDLSAHRDVRVKEYTNLLRTLRGEPLLNRLV